MLRSDISHECYQSSLLPAVLGCERVSSCARGDVKAKIIQELHIPMPARIARIELCQCPDADTQSGREMFPEGKLNQLAISDRRTSCSEATWQAVSTGVDSALDGEVSKFTVRCPTASGKERWLTVTLSPVFDRHYGVVQIEVSSHDITEFKTREAELECIAARQQSRARQLTQQLAREKRRLADARRQNAHAEKMRMLGQLVGGVVHDMSNVLGALQGATRILRRRCSAHLNDDIFSHVDQAVTRGTDLVNQLLRFSRQEELEPELLSPFGVVASQAGLLQHLVGSDANLTVDVPDEGWDVKCQPQRLQSVLFNLVANARDAVGQDGEIMVRVRDCKVKTSTSDLPIGDYVVITIVDNGCGMSSDVLDRLGEPFFTTKRVGRGTGLGLMSAFELAEACGGQFVVDSKLGEGTRVSLYLPRNFGAAAKYAASG